MQTYFGCGHVLHLSCVKWPHTRGCHRKGPSLLPLALLRTAGDRCVEHDPLSPLSQKRWKPRQQGGSQTYSSASRTWSKWAMNTFLSLKDISFSLFSIICCHRSFSVSQGRGLGILSLAMPNLWKKRNIFQLKETEDDSVKIWGQFPKNTPCKMTSDREACGQYLQRGKSPQYCPHCRGCIFTRVSQIVPHSTSTTMLTYCQAR